MDNILKYIKKNQKSFIQELNSFLAIPSVSTKEEYRQDMARCADWLANHLKKIGMNYVRIFQTKGHPIVYADWLNLAGKPTVLLYGHYDVQPPEPLELWISPPFEGTIRNGKLFARGTSDDKGQIFIHFKSIEAFLKNGSTLPINLKIILEGEEEIGSTNLEPFIKKHKELLQSDLALISDTSMFTYDVPSICYGLRGLQYMQIELTGPNRDLHSGSYGGSIHNPIQALSEIIAKLHDKNGRVTIPGFYDDVRKTTSKERASFKKLPWSDKEYAKDLGVKTLYGENGFTTLERLWLRPTLDCNGIWGGFIGDGAKTILPSKAYAKISMRLVPDQKPERVAKLFESYIKKISPKTVTVSIKNLHGGEPAITPLDSPGIHAAVAALEKGFGKKPLFQREGGSIPVVVSFKKLLGIDTVLLGFAPPNENAHAPNEFISLDNFFNGIKTIVHFYNELPKYMDNKK